jgi:hypothetical protein
MDTHDENIAQLELPEETRAERRGRKKAKPASGENDPEKLGRGHKLSAEKKDELVKVIRQGLINGMHPLTLKQGVMTQFKLSRLTVEKYMHAVRQEQLKEVGYYRESIQEICQKALVEIVKKPSAQPGAVVRAVQMLHNIFDIRVTPEDTSQQKKLLAEEAMAKMDSMTIQELQEFSDQLRRGGDKLTPEMLLMTPAELDERSVRHKKRKGKDNARAS